jgi:hypothetical protein
MTTKLEIGERVAYFDGDFSCSGEVAGFDRDGNPRLRLTNGQTVQTEGHAPSEGGKRPPKSWDYIVYCHEQQA